MCPFETGVGVIAAAVAAAALSSGTTVLLGRNPNHTHIYIDVCVPFRKISPSFPCLPFCLYPILLLVSKNKRLVRGIGISTQHGQDNGNPSFRSGWTATRSYCRISLIQRTCHHRCKGKPLTCRDSKSTASVRTRRLHRR